MNSIFPSPSNKPNIHQTLNRAYDATHLTSSPKPND